MTDGVNLYQSDVATLSDEELKVLSEELQEAYERNSCDGGYWTDDAAEDRYWQLQREMRHRWEISNPEAAAKMRQPAYFFECMQVATESIAKSIDACAMGFPENLNFSKIGDTIHVRRPARFNA